MQFNVIPRTTQFGGSLFLCSGFRLRDRIWFKGFYPIGHYFKLISLSHYNIDYKMYLSLLTLFFFPTKICLQKFLSQMNWDDSSICLLFTFEIVYEVVGCIFYKPWTTSTFSVRCLLAQLHPAVATVLVQPLTVCARLRRFDEPQTDADISTII